jgi:hypothetical protein
VCTLTILPRAGGAGLRLASSRDEARARPEALPPRERAYGGLRALLPVDPASGGTWVAANSAGLALALLNVNRPGLGGGEPRRSRGTIIPALLGCADPDEARRRAEALRPADFPPFRLVLAGAGLVVEGLSDGVALRWSRGRLEGPLLWTSSGLGDHLVEGPRRRLFERALAARPTPQAQDAFHRHRWPGRPHLSVRMSRPDARTVSYTVVEVTPEKVSMKYSALAEPAGRQPAGAP